MPLFYIRVDNGEGFQEDTDGPAFDNVDTAREHAVVCGAEIVADELKDGCRVVKPTLHIFDAGGERVTSIAMMATVDEATH